MAKSDKAMRGKHASIAQKPSKGIWDKSEKVIDDDNASVGGVTEKQPESFEVTDDSSSAFVANPPSSTTVFPAATSAFGNPSASDSWGASAWEKSQDQSSAGDEDLSSFYHEAGGSIDDYRNKKHHGNRVKRVLSILGGVLVGLIAVAYIAGIVYFSGHFFPNTVLGAANISNMDKAQAESALQKVGNDYSLTVTGDGLDFTITKADANLDIDTEAVLTDALAAVPAWQWPYQLTQSHDVTDSVTVSYDAGLGQLIRQKVEAWNATATNPVDASIVYDAVSESFVVKPEVYGTMVLVEETVKTIENAVAHMDNRAVLGENEAKKPALMKDDPRLVDACDKANNLLGAQLTLTMGGATIATVDTAAIASWVSLDANVNPSINQDLLRTWVEQMAEKCNTIGTTRAYTRPDGVACSVTGGVYGWDVDNETLIATINNDVNSKAVTTVEIPCLQTGQVFTALGAQDWGTRYVDVDLTSQHATFYDAGQIIWESDIISGKPDGEHDTPQGVWQVTSYMESGNVKLTGAIDPATGKPEYISYVTFWMPFEGNSVAFHDATWQSGFGGTLYASGYGSHGCINLSYAAAQELYGIIEVGDVVVAHS